MHTVSIEDKPVSLKMAYVRYREMRKFGQSSRAWCLENKHLTEAECLLRYLDAALKRNNSWRAGINANPEKRADHLRKKKLYIANFPVEVRRARWRKEYAQKQLKLTPERRRLLALRQQLSRQKNSPPSQSTLFKLRSLLFANSLVQTLQNYEQIPSFSPRSQQSTAQPIVG